MGYWIFMTCMCLLIPGILIAIGSVARNNAPKDINPIYGYRTTRSMKNKDTWEFANTYFGKLAWKWGLIMLIVTFIPMLAAIWAGEEMVSIVGGVVVTLQLIPLLGMIPVVESALKKEFDKDGNRRHNDKGNG
ncbi:MAG: SdpI family protein [Oscillospiraceae bacterium]|nr:SdpI family protein [Oscillospiraceae bacterium]